MREIKFRAWDRLSKMFVHNSPNRCKVYIDIDDGDAMEITYSKYAGENVMDVISELEVMQYTGLKDKNGKEIYEGDIVSWKDGEYVHKSNPRIAVVEFSPEIAFYAVNCEEHYNRTERYGVKKGYGHKFGFSNFIYKDTERNIEIIGNIYENKELINQP